MYQTAVKPMTHKFLEGKSGLLFAYGMTNAGKTFTIHGTEEYPGILPQAIQEIMDLKDESMSISLSFLEVYNDKVFI